jgi:hypothetical protein
MSGYELFNLMLELAKKRKLLSQALGMAQGLVEMVEI